MSGFDIGGERGATRWQVTEAERCRWTGEAERRGITISVNVMLKGKAIRE